MLIRVISETVQFSLGMKVPGNGNVKLMANTLSPSGLKTTEPGENILTTHNFNWTRLNDFLLYFSNLMDCDKTNLVDGQIMRYNSVTSKWEPKTPTLSPHTTTTTTSTTTTTTTV